MADGSNSLQKQLETEKFLRAIQYVENTASGIKKLTIAELAYLNQLVGTPSDDPWRFDPVEVQIPTGNKLQFNVLSNPYSRARDIVGDAYLAAANGDPAEGCCHIYSQLVLSHLFKDANRRTAVLASYWILIANELSVNAEKLLQLRVGDLRNANDLSVLQKSIRALVNAGD